MSKPIRLIAALLICAVLLPATGSPLSKVSAASPAAGTSPTLVAAASYSVLAGSEVTNTGTGATHVSGDLGVFPGIGDKPHVHGVDVGMVGPPGEIHDADTNATNAQLDNIAAFGYLAQNCDVTYMGVQDLTLVSPLLPKVYCADAFRLTGNLALTGSGVWIFKSASDLTTSPGSSVTGGDPCNVWWRVVSSASLDTNTTFIGNILASTAITMKSGAKLKGRALAQTANVTMIDNTISECSGTTAIAMREFRATSAAGSPIGLGAGAGLLLAVGLIVIRRRVQATPNAAPSARQGDGK